MAIPVSEMYLMPSLVTSADILHSCLEKRGLSGIWVVERISAAPGDYAPMTRSMSYRRVGRDVMSRHWDGLPKGSILSTADYVHAPEASTDMYSLSQVTGAGTPLRLLWQQRNESYSGPYQLPLCGAKTPDRE